MLANPLRYADRHPEGSLTALTLAFLASGGAAFAAHFLECGATWPPALKSGLAALALINWIALGVLYVSPYESRCPPSQPKA